MELSDTNLDYKYIVLKWDDVEKYLVPEQMMTLDRLLGVIEKGREGEGKPRTNDYVVVNLDEDYAPRVVDIVEKAVLQKESFKKGVEEARDGSGR